MTAKPVFRRARCACGQVAFVAEGPPIISAVCYCQGCQKGGAQMTDLPGAVEVRDADGGTPYQIYRDDRFRCLFGAHHMQGHTLTGSSRTTRFVASCCNTPMYLKYGPGHWVSAYRARFEGDLPPIEIRAQTKHRRADTPVPTDVPSHPGFPLSLIARLIWARVAMSLGR